MAKSFKNETANINIIYKRKSINVQIVGDVGFADLGKRLFDNINENKDTIDYWIDSFEWLRTKFTDVVYDYKTFSEIIEAKEAYISYESNREYLYTLNFNDRTFTMEYDYKIIFNIKDMPESFPL